MIAIVVDHCAVCPFSTSNDSGEQWMCTAPSFDEDGPARRLPDPSVPIPDPPDWCPLREDDRVVTLRRPR